MLAFRWARLLAFLILIITSFILNSHITTLNYAQASDEWLETPALILQSDIRYEQGTDNNQGSNAWPEIRYRYIVEGIVYESDNVWAGGKEPFQMSLNATLEIIEKYPLGKNTSAFYDPKKPEESALIPGVQNAHLQPFLIDIALFFIILLVLAVGKYLYKNSCPKVFFDTKLNSRIVLCNICNNNTNAGSRVCNYCGSEIFISQRMIFENIALLIFGVIGIAFTIGLFVSALLFLYLGYYTVFVHDDSVVFIFLGFFGFCIFLGFTYLMKKVNNKIWGLIFWKSNLS